MKTGISKSQAVEQLIAATKGGQDLQQDEIRDLILKANAHFETQLVELYDKGASQDELLKVRKSWATMTRAARKLVASPDSIAALASPFATQWYPDIPTDFAVDCWSKAMKEADSPQELFELREQMSDHYLSDDDLDNYERVLAEIEKKMRKLCTRDDDEETWENFEAIYL